MTAAQRPVRRQRRLFDVVGQRRIERGGVDARVGVVPLGFKMVEGQQRVGRGGVVAFADGEQERWVFIPNRGVELATAQETFHQHRLVIDRDDIGYLSPQVVVIPDQRVGAEADAAVLVQRLDQEWEQEGERFVPGVHHLGGCGGQPGRGEQPFRQRFVLAARQVVAVAADIAVS